ncbi:hypothetical protein GON01_10665 [Sphingomonas sp. MAH-20]|uniref:Uncharacterized protein n=1 Tax=Sphingomonas horti TaxID=2682842 RepID=A0A6I4J181_9SPHN|nr:MULTISPECIES: hypothetical protein [Sphingomonas]MBA2919512.1 hypothetical protein [Sphingomonas sp. CGMCC 1.13658]MVO78392.1 hypothetical protein [Sphingomonas horti]
MMSSNQEARTERNEAAAMLSADGQTYGDGARVTGPAQSCVPLTAIRNSRVLSDRVIDFGNGNRTTYRVVLPQDCPSLGFEQRFTYSTSLSQLCATDIITVLQSPGVTRGASCGLAPFQPIELPPRR